MVTEIPRPEERNPDQTVAQPYSDFDEKSQKGSVPNYRSQSAMPTVKIIIPTTSLEYTILQIQHASQHYHASPLLFFFCSTFNSNARLICGSTPPNAIVARISVSSSSSPRMASCRWRGVIRFTFRSLAALPASSSTSAVRYSSTAVTQTAAGAYQRGEISRGCTPAAYLLHLRASCFGQCSSRNA